MSKPIKNAYDARHEARKLVLQTLFEASFHACELKPTAARIQQEAFVDQDSDIDALFPALQDADLVNSLLDGIEKSRKQIDQLIARCAPEWPLKQLPKLDLNILRIAIYELYIAKSVPPKVAIDEAIELAKEFSGDSTSRFVNGALGTVSKLRERDSKAETVFMAGEFQPLHRGHIQLLKHIAARFPHIVIGLCGADAPVSADRPLTVTERQTLMEDVLATTAWSLVEGDDDSIAHPHFAFLNLKDTENDQAWLEQISEAAPDISAVYTTNQSVADIFSSANFPVFSHQMYKPAEYKCLEIRRRIVKKEPWDRLVPTKVERFLSTPSTLARFQQK